MNMIESVARAICKAAGDDFEDWDDWIEEAKAAIPAMREPTEAMFEAVKHVKSGWDEEDIEWVYQTMIDAALEKENE